MSSTHSVTRGWHSVYWALTFAFVVSGVLNVAGIRAGFLTNHMADIVVPAWLYLTARSLYPGAKPDTFLARTIGRTPARAALFILVASTVTELAQRTWPRGLFPGRFDPYDIVSYCIGVGAVYVAEQWWA